MQAEAEREKLRQSLHVPTHKLDKLMTVLPNLVERFRGMLHDLARATRYEIDKAREIVSGLVGEKKIVLYPTEDGARAVLHSRACGRLCRTNSPCFSRQLKGGGGDPDRTGDPRLMSSSENLSMSKKPQ